MPKRSKKPADLNRLAASIVSEATDKTPQPEAPQVRAGREGGRKGGKARAKGLSPARRSKIARDAANARWHGE